MLLEFRLTNFLSYKETQVFSLVANSDSLHANTNCTESGVPAAPKLLRSAVIYGANASGKSNLLAGLELMRILIKISANDVNVGIVPWVKPFQLASKMFDQPTEFEVTFVDNGVRYQYGFSATTEKVIGEWLLVYQHGKAQRWFEREYDAGADSYKWYLGSHLLGGSQRSVWKKATRNNALFLSTAVNLNSEQLRPIFNWFINDLVMLYGSQHVFNSVMNTAKRVKNDHDAKARILQFLQAADLGISDIEIEMPEAEEAVPGAIVEPGLKVVLFHQNNEGNEKIPFHFSQESHGTQRLFAYAAPLLDVLEQGRVLVVDELDSGLHPQMIRFLINLFHNSEVNKKGAQLIFSTHDTSLLDTEIFRRDQIWFVEKDEMQASRLYPLTDFSPRKDEALEKGYLMGRYGALPFFSELKL